MLFKSLDYLASRAGAPLKVESQKIRNTRQRDVNEMRLLDLNVLPFPCSKMLYFLFIPGNIYDAELNCCLLHSASAVRLQIVWGNQ